jgi:glycosyltransferase involved in cell wall biosynthesis
MASTPPVDIVIPTSGPVPYLEEALKSALAQTYQNTTVTVVDNSPESGGARSIVARYESDPRLRYLATGGLSQGENWTAAFRSGTAPYIGMLHDDDLWDPDFIERRVNALEAHPACAFVFSAYREIDETGRVSAVRASRIEAGVHQPETFVPRQFEQNVVPVATVLYRRAPFEAVGGVFHPAAGYLELELFIRIAVQYPVLSLDVHDCSMRVHDGSVTTTAWVNSFKGEMRLGYFDYAERAIDAARPDLVPHQMRRRRRAAATLTIAVDELQAGRAANARRLLRQAVRLHPPIVLDPRVALLALLVLVGPRAAGVVYRARRVERRWNIPIHPREAKRRADDLILAMRLRRS